MSYVVLARKYRPRSFEQMVGQEAVVRALTNALEQGRLHHAYLFTGTRGIGKTTVSRILAKSLNCTGADGSGGITAHPCGVCQACTEIDADRYIDYIELDAASNRSIDEVRDLIERAAYKPSVGRYKVFMIDEAHQLTKDAFNALLKTLEEPPEYLKFVLATTDPEKMLPTVLSRCLQFNLRPMPPDVVHQHLLRVLEAEGVPAEAGALRLLSRAARGSMRDALSLTDQAIAYGGGRLDEDTVRTMLGSVDRGHAARLVRALAGRDGPGLLAAVDHLRGQGWSAAGTLEEMAALLQQMAIAQFVPDALDDADRDTGTARELAALLPPDETQLLYSIVLQGRGELALAPDEYAALTMTLMRLMAFPPAGGVPGPAAGSGSGRPSEAAAVPTSMAHASPSASMPATSPARASAALQAPAAAAPARLAVPPAALPRATASPVVVPAPVPAPALKAPVPSSPPVLPAASAAARPPARAARPQDPPPWDPADEDIDRYEELEPFDDPALPPPRRAGPASEPSPEPPATLMPSSEVAEAPTAPAPAADPALRALGDRWAATVAVLVERQAVTALARELAMQGCLVAVDDGPSPVWRLQVERESLRAGNLVDKLQTALRAHLEQPTCRLEVQPGPAPDTPARRDMAERDRRQREAEQIIHHDPQVQQLMAQFATARIVPGSIKPH